MFVQGGPAMWDANGAFIFTGCAIPLALLALAILALAVML